MPPVPLTPLGVGDILNHAFAIYRDRFADLAKAVAVVLLPITVLLILLRLVLLGLDDDGGLALLAGLLAVVLSVVASQVATAACFQISGGAYVQLRPTWEESLAFGFARLRSLVSLELVVLVGILGGLLLFVLPGVYLAVAWQLAVPALLFEGLAGTAALKRSRSLLRGRWWAALGLFVVLGFLSSTVSAVLSSLVAGIGRDSNDVLNLLVTSLAGLGSSVLTLPLMAAATTVLYVQALARAGEVDLDRLATRLAGA